MMKLDFIPLVLVLALSTNAQAPDSPVERRIQRVEQGLRSSYGDPPWEQPTVQSGPNGRNWGTFRK